MTRLNLLGAQRVKALTEILERKYADKITEVKRGQMTGKQATENLAIRKDLVEPFEKALGLVEQLNSISGTLYHELGVRAEAILKYRDYGLPQEVRKELDVIIDNGTKERIKELKRELEEKKSQLWLVETLEQAQAIVKGDE